MTKPIPSYLRIHTEDAPGPSLAQHAAVDLVCRAFARATGWSLAFDPTPQATPSSDLLWSAPVNPGVGTAPGHFRIEAGDEAGGVEPRIELELAAELAGAMALLAGDLYRAEHALWLREGELATLVPVRPHADDAGQVAARLEAVLASGAQAVGCYGAGLYLLDADTTHLKLRSCWGLPRTRLADPPRPLSGALADLEALLGHAVVLDAPGMFELWRAPLESPVAVCVPVSTATVPLGTLWMFAQAGRTLGDRELGVIEVVAGRLAAELERQTLLVEGLDGARLKRQVALAERMQQDQLPRILPRIPGWEIAAWSAPADRLGGDFYDWFPLPDERLALAVGDAQPSGLSAALVACSLRAALRAHGACGYHPAEVVARVNDTIWSGSSGDQLAGLCYLVLDGARHRLELAAAGNPLVLRIGRGTWQSLIEPSVYLGSEPTLHLPEIACELAPGELVVVASEGLRQVRDERGRPLAEAELGEMLLEHRHVPLAGLIELVRIAIERERQHAPTEDQTILILRRPGEA